jgi:hypothetical protein
MSRYTHFTNLKYLIFLNGGSINLGQRPRGGCRTILRGGSAEALRHHATTEEDTREGGHRWLSQLTTGPSNLMDGDHKLREAKIIHVPRCHNFPGRHHAADHTKHLCLAREVVRRARRSATHRFTCAPTSKQPAPQHSSVRSSVAPQALLSCKRIERGTGDGEMRLGLGFWYPAEITVHEMGCRGGRCA